MITASSPTAQGALITPIFVTCYMANIRAQFPLRIFFPSAEAMPGEHQVVCRVGAAFVIQALPKSGPTMLLGWSPPPPPLYCVLNLTPCRPCISVKFPGLLCFVLGRMSGCSFPQELVLVGADSTTLCRSTLAVSTKYRWFFDHTKTKNYEDIKNLNVAVPQHPGF